ncbi:MAG: hypothetical protein H6981_11055 [Gammaproteobacteria bacterium]|nr:hypothetical protein [Gammaproteobacteria bacterium]MCP5137324.1 hypothetical protein [Gammaproteobacteria bacterium]
MKAILIDPEARLLDVIDLADTAQIAELIGYHTIETDEVGEQGDRLHFDEECFIRGSKGRFQIDSLIPVAGKGVVVGADGDGGLSDVAMDVEALRARTKFL